MANREAQGGNNLKTELMAAIFLSLQAGAEILEVYQSENFSVQYKEDNTPLTLADRKSNEVIVGNLRRLFPDYALLSEESKDDPARLNNDWCWIIDPLDGTKEFIKRNGEFTVNIALINQQEPVLGVIYLPVTGDLYYAAREQGAYYASGVNADDFSSNQLFPAAGSPDTGAAGGAESGRARELPASATNFAENVIASSSRIEVSRREKDLRVVKSRSHASERLTQLLEKNSDRIADVRGFGSSLKGCMIARGEAEVYYRFNPTMEWDVAAMDCIVVEAGGIMRNLKTGERLKYNRKNSLNEDGFFLLNREENRLE